MPAVIVRERGAILKKYYDNPQYNAAFGRCIDVMTKLVLKYGPQILEDPHPESHKVGQKAILLDTGTEAFEKVA